MLVRDRCSRAGRGECRTGSLTVLFGRHGLGAGEAPRDDLVEQPGSGWRNEVEAATAAAGGLAEDRHVAGIPAERLGVALHPPQGGLLVDDSNLAGLDSRVLLVQRR